MPELTDTVTKQELGEAIKAVCRNRHGVPWNKSNMAQCIRRFERMYDSSARGEGNDINVDYMRLCEGLRITISAAPISHEMALIVRIASTERSDDGNEELYVVEVTEEFDDCELPACAPRSALLFCQSPR